MLACHHLRAFAMLQIATSSGEDVGFSSERDGRSCFEIEYPIIEVPAPHNDPSVGKPVFRAAKMRSAELLST